MASLSPAWAALRKQVWAPSRSDRVAGQRYPDNASHARAFPTLQKLDSSATWTRAADGQVHHSDLGDAKRPDYLARTRHQELVCEVKSFDSEGGFPNAGPIGARSQH